jgi:signal transduction histidine kinase
MAPRLGSDAARLRRRLPARATSVLRGTGLGLAIAAQQVALHEGEMHLGESALGGLAIRIRFPCP